MSTNITTIFKTTVVKKTIKNSATTSSVTEKGQKVKAVDQNKRRSLAKNAKSKSKKTAAADRTK